MTLTRITKNRAALLLLVCMAALSAGCAKNIGVSGLAVTADQKVTKYNGQLLIAAQDAQKERYQSRAKSGDQ